MLASELPSNFFPVLHPSDWDGLDESPNRPLIDCLSSPLLISFEIVDSGANQPIPKQALAEMGIDQSELEVMALERWLQAFATTPWQNLEPLNGHKVIFARSESEAFSSGLVSPGYLKGMHRSLGEERIYVGAPDRYTLVACADPLNFRQLVEGFFDQAEEAVKNPLCRDAFISEGGNLIGYLGEEGEVMAATDIPHPTLLGPLLGALSVSKAGTEGQDEFTQASQAWLAALEEECKKGDSSSALFSRQLLRRLDEVVADATDALNHSSERVLELIQSGRQQASDREFYRDYVLHQADLAYRISRNVSSKRQYAAIKQCLI